MGVDSKPVGANTAHSSYGDTMNLIKTAIIGLGLTVGMLVGSTNVKADPIIVIVMQGGWRITLVCNPQCVVQDRYWVGTKPQ